MAGATLPLLDNFYDPSRQSADSHNWNRPGRGALLRRRPVAGLAPRLPLQRRRCDCLPEEGHLWDVALKAGVSFKNYGEYIEHNTFLTPTGSNTEPQWIDFYNDVLVYESGKESQLYNTIASHSPLPNLISNTVQNYPQFDLGIPDQFRFDIWALDFATT